MVKKSTKKEEAVKPVVKIKLDGGIMPEKANPTDAAWDLYAPEDVELKSGRQVVDLKFSMELPHGYAATIQPRSGFSVKGMEVRYCMNLEGRWDWVKNDFRLDADVIRGLVDEKYRNHVGVIVKVNSTKAPNEKFVLKKGTRLAQMQIVTVPQIDLEQADELDMSDNRGGGFGHTGA